MLRCLAWTARVLATSAPLCVLSAPAFAQQAMPPQPAAAQPTLPQANPAAPTKLDSPVVEEMVHSDRPALLVRKTAARAVQRHRRIARHHDRLPRAIDRPALAGVELVAPLPPPEEPPHILVPMPAFPLDSIAAGFTTPPPPIVCRRTRRDVDAPDPHLYREVPVECEPDTP